MRVLGASNLEGVAGGDALNGAVGLPWKLIPAAQGALGGGGCPQRAPRWGWVGVGALRPPPGFARLRSGLRQRLKPSLRAPFQQVPIPQSIIPRSPELI